MSDIQISLCASANRPILQNGVFNWERLMTSLKGNNINYEVIFVGDVKPPYPMPKNFTHIYATVKPTQCYEIAFRHAKGELIGWMADDSDYNASKFKVPNPLDVAYEEYKKQEKIYNDNKTVIAMRPVEGGNPDVQEKWHRFFGGCLWSPVMAPFGLIHRDFFFKETGTYCNTFVSGQCENDIVMRAYEHGGRVQYCPQAYVLVHHSMVHPKNLKTGKEDNKFRKFYPLDRKALEDAWVVQGYGHAEGSTPEKLQKEVTISKTRLVPYQPFIERDDWLTVTQGEKGMW